MNHTARTIGITVLVTLVMVLLMAATCVYSGMYNMSAAGDGGGIIATVLGTTADHSIRARATAPAIATPDAAAMEEAAVTFHQMCVVCHSGPGVPRGIIGEGMSPLAADLSKRAAGAMSEAEIFWTIRNGIRFTGMPGFSQSHSDEQLWAITQFVKSMDGMSEAEYEAIFRGIMARNGGVLPGAAPGATQHQH